MKLTIVLEKEEDGGYSAHCPALKGCHSQGRTREEALENMQEAIELYLEVSHDIASRLVTSRPDSILIDFAV